MLFFEMFIHFVRQYSSEHLPHHWQACDCRRGSRINIDRFPKREPKASRGSGACTLVNFFRFLASP